MTPEIKKFLQGLLVEANLGGLEPKLEEELLRDLYVRLEDRLVLTAASKLNPEKLEEFKAMTDKGVPAEEVEKFLRENVANIEQVFAESMNEFREVYLNAMKPQFSFDLVQKGLVGYNRSTTKPFKRLTNAINCERF